jgi:carboxypeptidase family protein
MPHLCYRSAANYFFLWLLFSLVANFTWAQSETATVSGQVVDPSGLNVTGVQVKLVDIDRETSTGVTTSKTGLYTFPSVRPGRYRIEVTASGFKVVNVTGLVVNVQDHIEQNFKLAVGSVSESVTVEGGASLVDTESAAVSTVVDRQFAENLPMNGRSFQTLIELTPGVVVTPVNSNDTGQFSVNGQRASSNYWMVDGVSANIGIGSGDATGNGIGGAVGSFSVLGGTNSLVSVDALQEFRIQTSTFAPEFGRTPGAQISIATRSGTNQFHGSAFNYLRNDIFDANNWFNTSVTPALPKSEERQNDFGGTFGGPILADRSFFFFSYEGLRLRLPQTQLTDVPDVTARQNSLSALQPYLNAFPLPNGSDNLETNVAEFNASFSNPARLDASSLRVDHKLSNKLSLFGRYNYSPSEIDQRGSSATSLSTVSPAKITTQTGTVAALWNIYSNGVNDLRFNYSSVSSSSYFYLDNFGGAVPLMSLPYPGSFTNQNAVLSFIVLSLGVNHAVADGLSSRNEQHQFNIVDSVTIQKGLHGIKIGVDFRRLTPILSRPYVQEPLFLTVPQSEQGTLLAAFVEPNSNANLLFRNLGVFAQDTWRIFPRVTVTYGVRWDVDFVPSATSGPDFNAVTGFDLSNLSDLALAPAGTPPYKTTYINVGPRIGLAYQMSQSENWQRVLRGGFGLFYDLASSEAGNSAFSGIYPFGASKFVPGSPLGGTATFPLTPSDVQPPPIAPPNASNGETLYAFNPNLDLPYTLQWNVSLEQATGNQQSISASYIGSVGRRLIQTASVFSPNSNFAQAQLVTNAGASSYNSLQVQFKRRLLHGLQALASYTWSHSIDTASAGSIGNQSNALTALNSNTNRGSSDFDIRNAFSAGMTYEVPTPKVGAVGDAILGGWSTENVLQARSAPPVDIFYDFGEFTNGFATNTRPDLVPGNPLYLFGNQYPGRKALNPGAFAPPPLDPISGFPLSQGNLPRNALRGFGATQWDFAVHREFPIHESIKLQFRAEMFNVLNHPNFGQPIGDLGTLGAPNPQFGQSMEMLGQSLAGGNLGGGAFNPLYQIGGPRSLQFALKVQF